jgi:hypothetical protein
MAKQNINVGTTANDKKGDSLRAAFQKVNANFTELYAASTVTFPSQTGNANKYLKTDGTTLSWGTVATDISQLSSFLLRITLISTHLLSNIQQKKNTLLDFLLWNLMPRVILILCQSM